MVVDSSEEELIDFDIRLQYSNFSWSEMIFHRVDITSSRTVNIFFATHFTHAVMEK